MSDAVTPCLIPAARPQRAVLLAGFAVPVLTIAAYAGLLPLGQWQADEYQTFIRFREEGLGFLLQRMADWSPRPISETLLFAYAKAVDLSGLQLVTPLLAFLWSVLILAAVWPALASRRDRPARLLLSLGLLALLLSGHDVAEVFYWTQGAIAYLPTLAAVLFVALATMFAAGEGREPSPWLIGAALCVAAGASEMGTFFVLILCAGIMILLPIRRLWSRAGPPLRSADAQYLVPLALALGVLFFIARGRLGSAGEVFGDPVVAHDLWASLQATGKRLPGEVLALGRWDNYTQAQLVVGFASKLMLAGAGLLVFREADRPGAAEGMLRLFALAVALVGTAAATLLGAFHQFGTACCERHETMRECFVLIAILAVACLAATLGRKRIPGRPRDPQFRPAVTAAFVALSVFVANAWTYEALARQYTNFPQARAARLGNWNSGRSSGPDMTFTVVPLGGVVASATWPTGSFRRNGTDLPPNVAALLDFFDKSKVVFVPSYSEAGGQF